MHGTVISTIQEKCKQVRPWMVWDKNITAASSFSIPSRVSGVMKKKVMRALRTARPRIMPHQ